MGHTAPAVALLSLLCAAASAAPPSLLVGRVVERGRRTPLAGVQVAVRGEQDPAPFTVESDERGRFTVVTAGGALELALSAADHLPLRLHEQLAPGTRLEVTYFLDPGSGGYRTTVRGARARDEVARTTLSQEEVAKIPGTHGDALRAVTNLPGIARAPFDTGQLVIWGSAPGDSSVLVRGHYIPQAFHFGLGSSVFNGSLLESIDYLPGSFGVRYGRAVGGILDITPRSGARDGYHGYASIDFIDAGVLLEGPLGQGSFALAVRRSLVDGVLAAAGSQVDLGFTRAPAYWDYQAILDQPLLGGHLQLLVYGSDDTLSLLVKSAPDADPALKGQFETRIWFHALTASYRRRVGALDLEATVSGGPQHTRFGLGSSIGYSLDVVELDARLEARWRLSSRLQLAAGIDLASDWYQTTVTAPYVATEGQLQPPTAVLQNRTIAEGAWEWNPALYAEARMQLTPRLRVVPGVRVDYFSGQRATVDPRLNAQLEIAPRTFLRAGAGLFHQPAGAPYADAQLGNPALHPQAALHFSAGVESRPFARLPSLSLRATGFYKQLWNLPSSSEALIVRGGRIVPELYTDSGVGRVIGLELLVRQDLSRWLWGWIAYTLLRSERQDHPGDPWRPFQFDQTHILTIVLSSHLPWRIDVGGRFRFVTGNPDTPIAGAIFFADQDVYVPLAGALYASRQPEFVQLDLRVDKRFLFDRWWLSIYVDVTNVTNRKNVDGYVYSYDYTARQPVTGLPIFPSLGVKAAF